MSSSDLEGTDQAGAADQAGDVEEAATSRDIRQFRIHCSAELDNTFNKFVEALLKLGLECNDERIRQLKELHEGTFCSNCYINGRECFHKPMD